MTGLGKAKIYEVQAVVAQVCSVTVADFKSATRRRDVSIPRQYAMYLARELTGQSFPQIGRMFGDRHHTTVMFADTKIAEMEAADESIAAALNECRARIAALVSERIGKMVTMQTASSDWSPPPPARTGWLISKPSTVIASIDADAWLACAA